MIISNDSVENDRGYGSGVRINNEKKQFMKLILPYNIIPSKLKTNATTIINIRDYHPTWKGTLIKMKEGPYREIVEFLFESKLKNTDLENVYKRKERMERPKNEAADS
jgi:hypothetical protein